MWLSPHFVFPGIGVICVSLLHMISVTCRGWGVDICVGVWWVYFLYVCVFNNAAYVSYMRMPHVTRLRLDWATWASTIKTEGENHDS